MVEFDEMKSCIQEWFADHAYEGLSGLAKVYSTIMSESEKQLDYFSSDKSARHGTWLKIGRGKEFDLYICSECRVNVQSFDDHVRKHMRFCSECGAPMDGIEDFVPRAKE